MGAIVDNDKIINGTNAERLALLTGNLQPGTVFFESDTGDKYEWDGDSWVKTSSGGALPTSEQGVQWDWATPVNLSVSTTHAVSAVLDADNDIPVLLVCDVDIYLAQGTAPEATTTDGRLPADTMIVCKVAAGDKLSAESVAVSGTLNIIKPA